ncbi:ATP-dependent DNA helicase DinG [Niallia sp.]|uniref:ATP-dependent DNA helicase DinG n=1 Tax=Niallia sp. TaxID=2837523 RepID=UPI00289D7401|nr:ATP-dependent DNA helicase DinG [Niallia sp.]
MSNKFVVVDLETNGNSPRKGDRIIQFAAVVIENGKIVEEYSSLLNPLQPISPFIEELTGITDEMVDTAPIFEEIADEIVRLLEDAYFVAHNVLFDLSFLNEELEQAGFRQFYGPILDTVELARILYPTADSYKLTDLAAQEGIVHSRPHQADSDAYVTAELLLLLLEKLNALPQVTTKQLEFLSSSLKSDLDIYLQDLIQKKHSKLEYIPANWEVYRGLTLKRLPSNLIADQGKEQIVSFDVEKIEKRMEETFSFYQRREGQLEMMDVVHQALSANRHGLIEAGTGVGKSLGYLVPAAYFSIENKKQVIISTFTTQLQEQLFQKDLPLLKSILPFPITYTLLKGRNHYISLDKFEVSLKEQEDNYDIILTKMQILIWLTETETGDKDELNLTSGGSNYWEKIKNDGNFSLPISKEWASKDFYRRTRNAAQKANMIITNHALLVKDLTADQHLLPSYEYVIIDEGHHFEKTATKHFGFRFSYIAVRLSINAVGTTDQKQLMFQLENMLGDLSTAEKIEINQFIQSLHVELDELFRAVFRYVKKTTQPRRDGKGSYRLKNNGMGDWNAVKSVAERIIFLWKDGREVLLEKVRQLKEQRRKFTSSQMFVVERIESILNDWLVYINHLREMFLRDGDNIAWLETDAKNYPNNAVLYTQPSSVAETLQSSFFEKKKSVVFTSATITVNNSFAYYVNVLGLGKDQLEVQIGSPFNYDQQIQLLIPTDVPEVNTVSLNEYVSTIGEQIIKIAQATKGRMLILFTANDMLKKTYDYMKESGCLEEYAILAQGITNGSRMRLTRNFQRYDKAILLGTNSFWEGIDIPGEDLTCLIIVRLPFSSPEDPLTEAKNELIKNKGGNPFLENSLPEAVLRFKQGFGRLIRTEADKGFIIVFDRRIVTTSYGETFLQSIPAVPIKQQNSQEMVSFIEEWLK